MALCAIQGADVKPEYFDPVQRLEAYKQAQINYPRDVANTLLGLKRDKLIPNWVMMQIDFDQVELVGKQS